jgi:iron complex outermembrane receptor protein
LERKKNLLLPLVLCLLLLLGSAPAWCADDDEESDEFTLDEITVTAQKREENQQKVAISMDVISGDDINELGKNNLDEILNSVSSAIIQKASDGYRISIRGISDDSSANVGGQSMAAPSVAVNTDGVYSNRKDTGASLFDVERVEVLYGPQSTMYASNSPGGVVNVVTASPKLDKFSVSAMLEAGNYNLIRTQGAVNVPVAGSMALRASFTTTDRDGYMDDGGDNEDTKSGRLRALYEPADAFSVTVTGEYSKNKGASSGGGVVLFGDESEVDDPWTAAENEAVGANDQDSYKVFANMELDTSIAAFTFVPSYSSREGTSQMSFMGETMYAEQDVEDTSLELRIASPADFFFKWLVGFNYYEMEDSQYSETDEFRETGFDGTGTMSDRSNEEVSKAAYGNVTYPVVETFRLTAGIRASWDEMTTDNYELKPENGVMQIKDENPTTNTNDARPDYKFGFEYDLADNSMFYGDYSTSYRVQAMSAESDPQELKAYTLGAKNRFLDNKLQLNIAAYYQTYTNYNPNYRKEIWWWDYNGDGEVTRGGPPGSGDADVQSETEQDDGTQGVTGDGEMYGVDLSASYVITSKDMVNMSLAYMHSEWTDLYFDWEHELQWDATVGGQVPLEDSDYSGKPMTNTPEWTINLTYNRNFNLWNGGVLKASATVKYQSAYNLSWNEEDEPYNYQEAHFMENASLAYNHPGGTWSLSTYCNNITNYAEKRNYMNAGGMGMLNISDPRTYGAVLTVKF